MRHLPSAKRLACKHNRTRAAALLALAGLPILSGCEADSWLDPSVVGRWEHTPTVVPILDRVASIERDDVAFVETSEATPEDLIPVASEYRLTTGDGVIVKIRDFLRMGEEAEFERLVDRRGYIEIPRLTPIRVQGLSAVQARDAIAAAIKSAGLLDNPTVSVVPSQQRQQTFSAMGSVLNPGTYFIPAPDYRLLQALTAAGGFSEGADYIYVIRQVPLGEAAGTGAPTDPTTPPPTNPPTVPIDRLIDELSQPKPPAPGMLADGESRPTTRRAQPPEGGTPAPQPPPIDLPDSSAARPTASAPAAAGTAQPNVQWNFVNGQWVRVQPAQPEPGAPSPAGSPAAGDVLVAQRVIKVPTAALIAGAAKYNIIVRPGDILRVPSNVDQFFYIGGQISRPGVYSIPRSGITLLRGLMAAGDMTGIAIPERVDLTRKIGSNQQATIRLNVKAIGEGTNPDIYLKNDDMVNIGTNFWAYPLAVIRNGVRASYGYGFILDRNFGSDVFGVPPEAAARN